MNDQEVLDLLKQLVSKVDDLTRQHRSPPQGYFSLKTASAHYDLSQKTIRRLISAGKLRAYRPVKGKILIKRTELDAYVESCTAPNRKGRGIRH